MWYICNQHWIWIINTTIGLRQENVKLCIEIKSCTLKNIIKKVKRQPAERGKIVRNHTSDKGLESGIYKELLLFSDKITQC